MKVTGTGASPSDNAKNITGTSGSSPVSPTKERRPSGRSAQADGEPSEKVAISGKAREAARAKEIAKGAPDIDEAKVARLKAALEAQTYKVDADKVADRLVDEHLFGGA